MTRTLAVVSAGLRDPSSSQLLADRISQAVESGLASAGEPVEVERVELRLHARDLADQMVTGFPSPVLRAALDAVASADAVVVVTPVFNASYSGLFKTFFDALEPGSLDGTPVLVAATAGTARHSLVLDHALRPLFSYLRASVVPTGVFAATEDWGSRGTASGALGERVDRAARELVAATLARPAGQRPADEFDDLTPFEELLGRH